MGISLTFLVAKCYTILQGDNMTGKELKAKRKAKGLTQEDLAKISGVHRVTIARWENGVHKIHPIIANFLEKKLR